MVTKKTCDRAISRIPCRPKAISRVVQRFSLNQLPLVSWPLQAAASMPSVLDSQNYQRKHNSLVPVLGRRLDLPKERDLFPSRQGTSELQSSTLILHGHQYPISVPPVSCQHPTPAPPATTAATALTTTMTTTTNSTIPQPEPQQLKQ